MVDFVIYGKIIIDDIRLRGGGQTRRALGGGGPQAVFGARVWSDSVGFLSRSGTDLAPQDIETLRGLDADLTGWTQFADIPTPQNRMRYDANEYLIAGGLITSQEDWNRLLAQPLTLPPAFQQPRAIHLVTEFGDEPLVATALDLRRRGAVLSLEPLASAASGPQWQRMAELMHQVDLVSPDWPTASLVAASDDPLQVIQHWSRLGPEATAIRHGARGSYVWDRRRDTAWHVPAVPVDVVDPTGAGNAYGGGLCVGWTDTRDARLAGCMGAVSASILVRNIGLPRMTTAAQAEASELLELALAGTTSL